MPTTKQINRKVGKTQDTGDGPVWQDMGWSQKMEKLANDGIFSDCQFIVGPEDSTAETIFGHKLLFIIGSPVFERMFSGDFVEASKTQPIRIVDVSPHDFKIFRSFIYNNDYNTYSKIPLLKIFALYRIADKYLASSISGNCINYLMSLKGLSVENVLMLYEFAFEIDHESLKIFVENTICSYEDGAILHSKINDFSVELFYEYMLFVSNTLKPNYNYNYNTSYGQKTRSGLVSSIKIFKAIETYLNGNELMKLEETSEEGADQDGRNEIKEHEGENTIGQESLKRKKKFDVFTFKEKLLTLVKFNEMSVVEFIGGPGESELLEYDRKYKLLTVLSK